MKKLLSLIGLIAGLGAIQSVHGEIKPWATQYINKTNYEVKISASFKTHLCDNNYPLLKPGEMSRIFYHGICNMNHVEAQVKIPIVAHEQTTGGPKFKWVQADTYKAGFGGFTGLPNHVYKFTVRQKQTDTGVLAFEVVKGDAQLLVTD